MDKVKFLPLLKKIIVPYFPVLLQWYSCTGSPFAARALWFYYIKFGVTFWCRYELTDDQGFRSLGWSIGFKAVPMPYSAGLRSATGMGTLLFLVALRSYCRRGCADGKQLELKILIKGSSFRIIYVSSSCLSIYYSGEKAVDKTSQLILGSRFYGRLKYF
jgi:hypothetical protein